MKKLVQGLLEFQRTGFPAWKETFARLAAGQHPDCFFVSCSDSRVVPNIFASTHPGELFVARNVGNMVPPADASGIACGDTSEASALEYALLALEVPDIVVCGHSGCGAMNAICDARVPEGSLNLSRWLELGAPSLARLRAGELAQDGLPAADQLSQINVLQQLENLRTYPVVRQRLAEGRLQLHAWWFDIFAARVHNWRAELGRFVPIDETEGERIISDIRGRRL